MRWFMHAPHGSYNYNIPDEFSRQSKQAQAARPKTSSLLLTAPLKGSSKIEDKGVCA